LAIGPREGTFGGEFGRAIVTNGDFTASVLRFAMVRVVGRGIAVLDGVHVVQEEGEV